MKKEKIYKIYIGQYERIGVPSVWTLYKKVKHCDLQTEVMELSKRMIYGCDIYVVYPDGSVKSYFRDKIFS